MSWYLSSLVLFFTIFVSGCSPLVQNGPKTIPDETFLILDALDSQQQGNADKAIRKYKNLYEKTENPEYLKESLRLAFATNISLEPLLKIALKDLPDDKEVARIHAGWLLRQEKIDEAKAIMHILVNEDKSVQNLTILGSIYFYQKKYDTALKYYDTIYKQEASEGSLMMIVELLDTHLGRSAEAASYLETHTRLQKSSKEVYYRLIKIYGKNKRLDNLISTYQRLYEAYKEEKYANKVVELLLFQGDRQGAIKFLKESKHSPELLMDLYTSNKEFKKAFEVAKSAYEKNGSLLFLGLMAIYQYEDAVDKNSIELLESVSNKFETVVNSEDDPLFLNYYGYLLIEHDIDINKGIVLVKRALEKEPDSPYYIDSLAWGYYKLNRCEKALEIIEPIVESVSELEVQEHYEAIQECVREKE